jgi:hypothetical protein
VSTLSAHEDDGDVIRRRQRHHRPTSNSSATQQRPKTMPAVVSAPNLRACRARLPDPPLDKDDDDVSSGGAGKTVKMAEEVVCGSGDGGEAVSVAEQPPQASGVVYMNVADCHGPEYVNMTPDLVSAGGKSKFLFTSLVFFIICVNFGLLFAFVFIDVLFVSIYFLYRKAQFLVLELI